MSKVSLAGIHLPDTTAFFGDAGILDATRLLAERGWHGEGRTLWMADHFRSAADMVVRWALSDFEHCSVEADEWFPTAEDRQRFLELLGAAKLQLREVGRLEKVERWLETEANQDCAAWTALAADHLGKRSKHGFVTTPAACRQTNRFVSGMQ